MSTKGRKHPPDCGHCSSETRAKISAARRAQPGRAQTADTRARISAGMRKPDDEVEYFAAHHRMRRYKPRTGVCSQCGQTHSRMEFALRHDAGAKRLSKWGKWFSTDFEDYVEMCPACHRNYDRAAAAS